MIDRMFRQAYSLRAIGRALGRSASTVSRELRRNRDATGAYNPHLAQVMYWRRRERKVRRYKLENLALMQRVIRWLKRAWSPEQIAGRLRSVSFPQARAHWISHESIYRYVRQDRARGGRLWRYLRRGAKHWSLGRGGVRVHRIRGRVGIEHRPSVVDAQTRFGDWEADTVYGAYRKGCVATLVERRSLYLAAYPMLDASAPALNGAVRAALSHVPNALIHTITVDNGLEFAHFSELEQAFDAQVYFARPYAAWERPINENTNGLLRQFLPRGKSMQNLSPKRLHAIVEKLNNRPRKKLGYRTPNEVFQKQTVALAT